jgi:hypothetical protein
MSHCLGSLLKLVAICMLLSCQCTQDRPRQVVVIEGRATLHVMLPCSETKKALWQVSGLHEGVMLRRGMQMPG